MKPSFIVATHPFHCTAFALFLLLNLAPCAYAAVPVVAGQVTASTSPTDFEVNGEHVLCDKRTEFRFKNPADATRFSWAAKPYLGEPLQIYGHEDRKAHLIHAKHVVFAPDDASLHGQGIIDRLLAPQLAGSVLVRADGYPILLTPATKINYVDPLKSFADIHTNQWLEYQGRQRPDGVMVADKATLRPNIVANREQHLQGKYAYDPKGAVPSSPPEDARGYVGRLFAGTDPKHVPPAPDPTLQKRIDSIGQRLVPQYQRDLADSEPTKITFRFQLIDEKRIKERIDLPNGIILVPEQTMMRFENDDEVAAYLADGIAAIFEKQQLRFQLQLHLLYPAQLGAPISPLLTVGVVNPALLIAASRREDLVEAEMEQRIRVGLALVHDAGYNLTEAPKTWWLLASKDRKPLTDIPIPDAAIYAYAVLSSTWRDTAWEK